MWNYLVTAALLATTRSPTTTTTTTTQRSPRDLIQQYQETYRQLEVNGDGESSHASYRVYPTAHSTLRFVHHCVDDDNPLEHSNSNNCNNNSNNNKPIALYLPGLDGYGISAVAQLNDLETHFDFWRLHVDRSDRSSFAQVVATIADFVSTQLLQPLPGSDQQQHEQDQHEQQRHVTLIGESAGGLLAAAVALQLQQKKSNNCNNNNSISGLVLVNPATSFEATSWDRTVPLLTSLLDSNNSNINKNTPSPYGILGSLLLASLIPDTQQTRRLWDSLQPTNKNNNNNRWELATTAPQLLYDSFQITEQYLPADMLEHRVTQWLTVGAPVVNARLRQLHKQQQQQHGAGAGVLVVVGAQDRLLPSRREAQRLHELCGAETLVVPQRGHFVLDDSVNLTEAILFSKAIDPLRRRHSQPQPQKRRYDPITDWKVSESEILEYSERGPVQTFRSAFSPVYFSTDAVTGKRWKGMGKLPSALSSLSSSSSSLSSQNDRHGRQPLLFVGNHQFAALDLQLLVADLWSERGIFVRGLAHPITFTTAASSSSASPNLDWSDLGGRRPGLVQDDNNNNNNNFGPGNFEKFGAVKVTPRNYYRLLQTGQDALLFPGGAKEALSGNASYPLFWPDKTDFVRTAARFNAIIVPVSAVGMVDSVRVVAEPQELLQWPVIGERLRQQQANLTAARYDTAPEDEIVGVPLALPGLPQRNYFLFGPPVDTSGLDPRDKEKCARVYQQVRDHVRSGVDDLLVARQKDTFRDAPPRLLYERVWGKPAPTFSVDELNQR